MGVCTKERKGVTAAVLMATPCTNKFEAESVSDSRKRGVYARERNSDEVALRCMILVRPLSFSSLSRGY